MARARMTQTDLADVLGLTQSAVSKRLRAKIAFSVDELEKVSDALGVHPASLLGGRGDSPQPPPTNTDWFDREFDTLSHARETGFCLESSSAADADDGRFAPVAA